MVISHLKHLGVDRRMYLYLSLFIEVGFAIVILVILWFVLKKAGNKRIINIRDASLTCEELEDHAKKIAIEHSVSKKQNMVYWPVPRMNENYSYILSVYKDLNDDIRNKLTIPQSAEWLLDNFYIIEEQVKNLRKDLSKDIYSRLPVLKCGQLKGYARIFAVAMELVSHTDGHIDENVLLNYLKAYQTHSALVDREIWAIPDVLRLALIENIRLICEKIKQTRTQWHKADEIVNNWLLNEGVEVDKGLKSLKSKFRALEDTDSSFIEHLFYRLRRGGQSYNQILKYMVKALAKKGTTTEIITQKEHNFQAVNTVSIGNSIVSLKFISNLEWVDLFESTSNIEKILKEDPDKTYPNMDLLSRNYYRNKIEELASNYGVSELHIASEAIELAKNAVNRDKDLNIDLNEINRKIHVGYYLIGKGSDELDKKLGHEASPLTKASKVIKNYPGILYFSSICFIIAFLLTIALHYSIYENKNNFVLFSILIIIIGLIPASEIAISTVNWIICKAQKPTVFPRLELKTSIPEELSSVIVIPALISDEKRVTELLTNLENHYLSNKEKNLSFALVGDFKDSSSSTDMEDEKIISSALKGIHDLNQTYSPHNEIFFFLQRVRKFNKSHNKWMGWERKRGALMEFNEYILGSKETSFKYLSSTNLLGRNIKYIITLDADTILPIGMAKKLIGTMAHPLNRPIIDEERRIVIDGYALLQPKISFDIESSNKTLFSRIFAGEEGLDPYACAVSDIYQDLFGEGIFTGKGIYDLKVFHKVLENTIPENTILSHDLLEGCYARTALATDTELVDSYPSSFSSYALRLHRWVRGDWQLLPWLRGNIINSKNEKLKNPLSKISRWKIIDNLRRSMVPIFTLLLIVTGFSVLPGSSFFWLGFSILVIVCPLIISFFDFIFSTRLATRGIKRHIPVISGLKAGLFQVVLLFIFLPYQVYLISDAVIITLTRVLFTKTNMLLWVTAADAEKRQRNSVAFYWSKMYISALIALVVVVLTYFCKPHSLIISLVLFILWGISPYIAYKISLPRREEDYKLSIEDFHELSKIVRRTYRYFEEFSNIKNNYLAPDNFQEDPPRGIAHRTSPTNIGLGLLATLTARDFGFLGTVEMIEIISKSLTTIERLEKWNGHLYNWYDTHSLRPLRPSYISTVDSGNLVCYLITLVQGLKHYLNSPLMDVKLVSGLRNTLEIYFEEAVNGKTYKSMINEISLVKPLDLNLWSKALNEYLIDNKVINIKKMPWKTKVDHMVEMFKKELLQFMPWVDCIEKNMLETTSYVLEKEIDESIEEILNILKSNPPLIQLDKVYESAITNLKELIGVLNNKNEYAKLQSMLHELQEFLFIALENSSAFIKLFKSLIERFETLASHMEFKPLYVEKKQLFSIGYNIEENRLTNSYYDLLASEARQTSFIAIARGEVPVSHWFKMGRALTVVDHYKGLVSWTGTMFEYLMPLLIMKSYKNTLMDETYSFVIRSQKKYGKQRSIPWGASESGFNSLDINLDYQYKAIGIPWLGLKRGLIEDAVSTPYATFLALLVDPKSAVENIKALKAEGLEGPYGFYEAVDYTPERLPFDEKRAIVKSFMAHHQGMSLLALNNYLNKNIMQERFHSDPSVKAAKLLLHEKVPTNIVLTKEEKERVMPFKEMVYKDKGPLRKYKAIDSLLPKAHILSNGSYSIMITDRGTGYSKNKSFSITRWREDSTLDYYGMFFYLKNIETNKVWAATYSPINVTPESYQVTFTADKVVYKRVDEQIETKTEVVVTSGDNAEIRTLKLKNTGNTPKIIEVTSYFEVVITKHAADAAHPAFSNLFIKTDYLQDKNCLIANRRPRSESEKSLWIANAVVNFNDNISELQYETDRLQFIGRTRNTNAPIVIEGNKPLSNTVGAVLDPIMSLRLRVKIEPGATSEIAFIVAISESYETLIELIEKYRSREAIEGAFRLALRRSQVEAGYLNMKASEIEMFQDILSNILFISPLRRIYNEYISQNRKGQSTLWSFGISGDLPIILLVLKKTDELSLLYELLKAHEYWRLKDLRVDLIILSEEENGYTHPLHALISDIVIKGQTHDILNKPGGIFILDKNNILEEELHLLYAVSRLILKGEKGVLAEQIKLKQNVNLPRLKQLLVTNEHFEKIALKEEPLNFYNGLGGFNKDGSEYVIKLEKGQNTPAPWINVISNPNFGFIVSETGSGYTWSENSRENKLTPWSNDPVTDSPGEVFYIGDSDTGELWTTTPLPIREDESYIIRHGFGYSVFEHNSHGILQSLIQYVPIHEAVKISIMKLENATKKTRNLTVTYYVRPVSGVSDQSTAIHIKTRQTKTGTLIIENPYNEEFPGRLIFMDVSKSERFVTSNRQEFFGSGGIADPDALKRERLSGVTGIGFDPCAVMQVNITVEPKQIKELIFVFGEAMKLEDVNEITNKYKKLHIVEEALGDIKWNWQEKLGAVKINTPDVSMDIMLNGWLPYQVLACRIWARSGFYQSGGAYGFRDQLQDSLSIAHICPKITHDQIILHARHQFLEGDVQHWWHEPHGKGTRTRFSDDLLWLPYVTNEYIRITGDKDILTLEMTFLEDEMLKEFEDEHYGRPKISQTKATLYDHCIRTIEKSLKFGVHELPLIGSGDWNDGMNTIGNRGLGESVWLGWFLFSVLESFIPVCREMGDNELVLKYQETNEKIVAAIEKNAWDGNWYRRAYFDNGVPLGSIENSECKIDAIAQSWAVISGAADPTRARQAMNSLENYLIQWEDGLIKLLTPPFEDSDLDPGYIKGYVPGVRENGGQYTHAAAWVIIAFAKLGDGDKAWELFELINPINHTRTHIEYSLYKVEPYVMAADVYAVPPHTGRGGWTWYTGSAGWMYRAGLEYILGFQKNGDNILMNPCIPKKWTEYNINYKYLDTSYEIKVKNPESVNMGVKKIIINGKSIIGNNIELINDGNVHKIEVLMGR